MGCRPRLTTPATWLSRVGCIAHRRGHLQVVRGQVGDTVVEVTKTTYKAHAARSGRWWAVEVPDVPGVFTQTRRLDQVAPAAREAISNVA